jgi:hypothetical protein
MENIDVMVLRTLRNWRQAGQRALLATVVRTWGSSPRPIGSIMALCETGAVVGSVSGGCIEDDLIYRFTQAYATGQSQKNIGALGHHALALMHRVHHVQLGTCVVGPLLLNPNATIITHTRQLLAPWPQWLPSWRCSSAPLAALPALRALLRLPSIIAVQEVENLGTLQMLAVFLNREAREARKRWGGGGGGAKALPPPPPPAGGGGAGGPLTPMGSGGVKATQPPPAE